MRYFTVEEANRALVLIRPIVSDIGEKRQRLVRTEQQLRTLRSRRNQHETAQLQRAELTFRKLIEQIEYHALEIAQVGCVLKDMHRSIIDFPSWHEGHEIYLCWQSAEQSVGHWHEIDAGFTRRRAIDEAFRPTHEISFSA